MSDPGHTQPLPPYPAPPSYPAQPSYPPPPPYAPQPSYPPYPPQQYGAPYGWAQPGWGPVAHQTTNGLAIASLVLGILWMWGLGSIMALVFGIIAKGQIRRSNGTQSGGGLATAGIILGGIGVAFVVLAIAFLAVASVSTSGSTY